MIGKKWREGLQCKKTMQHQDDVKCARKHTVKRDVNEPFVLFCFGPTVLRVSGNDASRRRLFLQPRFSTLAAVSSEWPGVAWTTGGLAGAQGSRMMAAG